MAKPSRGITFGQYPGQPIETGDHHYPQECPTFLGGSDGQLALVWQMPKSTKLHQAIDKKRL